MAEAGHRAVRQQRRRHPGAVAGDSRRARRAQPAGPPLGAGRRQPHRHRRLRQPGRRPLRQRPAQPRRPALPQPGRGGGSGRQGRRRAHRLQPGRRAGQPLRPVGKRERAAPARRRDRQQRRQPARPRPQRQHAAGRWRPEQRLRRAGKRQPGPRPATGQPGQRRRAHPPHWQRHLRPGFR
nr:hypothetical protein [Pseudomonas aeruginosa]